MTRIPRSLRVALIVTLLMLGVTVVRVLYPPAPPTPPVGYSVALPGGPRTLEGLSLIDQHGQTLGPEWFRGHWTLVFFGYTFCPDICPNTLYLMAETLRLLAETAADIPVKGLFISVDPNRDTPAKLAEYVTHFHPDLVAATGQRAQVDTATKLFGSPYIIHPPHAGDSDNYAVSHVSSVYFVDPQARLVGSLAELKESVDIQKALATLRQSAPAP